MTAAALERRAFNTNGKCQVFQRRLFLYRSHIWSVLVRCLIIFWDYEITCMNVGVKCCLETCGNWMPTCEVTSVVSDSLRPYGLKPARLLRLWDSPGKNTGVSCMPSSCGSSQPGDQTCVSALISRFFTTEPPRTHCGFFHGLCQMPY